MADDGAPTTFSGQIAASIRPRSAHDRSDRALAERAGDRHGVLTLAQLQDAGLSPRAVRHRAAGGRLTRMHAGVYAIGRPGSAAHWMAATLACGPGAALSHRSAAALWGIGEDPACVDVTVLSRHGRSRAGIAVHRGDTLGASDITVVSSIPCTTVARTLLDLAAIVDRRALERAIDRAETLRAFDLDALRSVLHRNRGRRGTRKLANVLATYSTPTMTRSEAEERLLAVIDKAGLRRPRLNAWIGLSDGTGYEADFLWPDARLVVEVDGRAYHARREAFEHDRRRDRQLALVGLETRRYAASELISDPQRVVSELRAFLGRRSRG